MKLNRRPLLTLLIGACSAGGLLSGCATAEQKVQMKEQKALVEQKLAEVRFISEEQTKSCEYVDQVTITQAMEFISGTAGLEPRAKAKLRQQAVIRQANALRVVDRVLSKGQGGYDKTRLMMSADVYRCDAEG